MTYQHPIPRDAEPPCSVDPELFFTSPVGRTAERYERAKAICAGCPLQDPCLAYALTHDVEGVWGKTSEAERQKWRDDNGVVARPLVITGMVPRQVRSVPGHGSFAAIKAHERAGEKLCDRCKAEKNARNRIKNLARRMAS